MSVYAGVFGVIQITTDDDGVWLVQKCYEVTRVHFSCSDVYAAYDDRDF